MRDPDLAGSAGSDGAQYVVHSMRGPNWRIIYRASGGKRSARELSQNLALQGGQLETPTEPRQRRTCLFLRHPGHRGARRVVAGSCAAKNAVRPDARCRQRDRGGSRGRGRAERLERRPSPSSTPAGTSTIWSGWTTFRSAAFGSRSRRHGPPPSSGGRPPRSRTGSRTVERGFSAFPVPCRSEVESRSR